MMGFPKKLPPKPPVLRSLPYRHNILFWLDPDRATYDGDGRCSEIADRSGMFVQGTASLRPYRSTYNGTSALTFSGSHWLRTVTAFPKQASWTMVAAVVPSTAVHRGFLFSSMNSAGQNAALWGMAEGGYGTVTKSLVGNHSDQATTRYRTMRANTTLPTGFQVWAVTYTAGNQITRLYVDGDEQAASVNLTSSPAPSANAGTAYQMALGTAGEWVGNSWNGTFIRGGLWSMAFASADVYALSKYLTSLYV